MEDPAKILDELPTEVVAGQTFQRYPEFVNYHRVARNIARFFGNYLEGKTPEVFGYGMPLFLSEENQFCPDCMIICDPAQVGETKVTGAPDLVVEVISPLTISNDRIHKPKAYEKHGVKEYWLISVECRSVEVHHLRNGRLELEEIFFYIPITPEDDPEEMDLPDNLTDAFPCELFPGLRVPLAAIFDRVTD